MQNQLDIATKWCHDYGLVINASKTKLMHIKPPHLRYPDLHLTFHNLECLHKNKLADIDYRNDNCPTVIEQVKTYKYLGVHIDQNFKWNIHIDEVRKKLRKASFMLYRLGNCSNNSVLRQAYFALAESQIRHGITAWGNSTHCTRLQQTQNQLLKILHKNQQRNQLNNQYNTNTRRIDNNINNHISNSNNNVPYIINTSLHNNINQQQNNHPTTITQPNTINYAYENNNPSSTSTNINNIATQEHILNIKSIFYTTMAIEFYNDARFLKQIDHIHNTRRKAKGRYTVQKYKNNYGKHSLPVSLPTIFNMIPPEIINTANIHKRKKLFKNFFMNLQ